MTVVVVIAWHNIPP